MKILTSFCLTFFIAFSLIAQHREEKKTDRFNSVSVGIHAEVVITKGSSHQLILEGDEENIKEIEAVVEGDRLKLKYRDNNWWGSNNRRDKIKVSITTPELTGVSLSGSGSVKSNDLFESDEFEAEVAGSGSIDLQINTKEAELDISGSGEIKISGSSETAEVNIAGSGDVEAVEFKVEEVEINIMGSGDCTVYVTEKLNTKIMGSGDVSYAGDPKHVNNNSMGSGDIRKL